MASDFNATDEHTLSVTDLCNKLRTDATNGLSDEEARIRYKKNGPNILKPPKRSHVIIRFIKTLFHGFSALLWFGAVLSIFIFFFDDWKDDSITYEHIGLAAALIIVILVTGIFSFYQEGKSDKVMQSFMTLLPEETQVIRNGRNLRLLAKKLVVGDILVLNAGDKVAADARIIESHSLKTDHSCVTGESDHLARNSECTDQDPLKTKNLVFFGTFAVEGQGKAIVIRTGEHTFMGSIARLTADIKDPPTTFAREISRFIFILVIWASCVGLVISVIMVTGKYKWNEALIFFIGTIIANVPEGLMPTLTLSLTLASKRMAARSCLVKKLEIVESLGTTSIICSDKTGTITQNRMTVSHLVFNRTMYGVDLIGVGPARRVYKKMTFQMLARCASLCSRAEFDDPDGTGPIPIVRRKVLGDASEAAILKCPEIASEIETSQWRRRFPKIFEIPFNSSEKRQLSVHGSDHPELNQFVCVMKGAPEIIQKVCSTIFLENEEVALTEEWRNKINNACSVLAESAERVLAFCDYENIEFTPDSNFSPPKEGFRFLGLISLIDPPRPNVAESVLLCRDAGIKVIMVTGDHHLTALAIARQVNIISDTSFVHGEVNEEQIMTAEKMPNAFVIKGDELESMSNRALMRVLNECEEIVFARTTPKQKLRIVESCQRSGGVVAVTGDGVNDAPALKKADIGISMGVAGSAVAQQASKLVLLDDNFATLVYSIEEGRLVFENLKKSIGYTLSHTGPEVLLLLVHIFAAVPLPMSVVAMLCIDVGTDLWPSIALAYERPEMDLMKNPPRNIKTDRLISTPLLVQIFKMGVLETLAALLAYFVVLAENGWSPYKLMGILDNWAGEEQVLVNSLGVASDYEGRKELEKTCYSASFVAVMVMQLTNALVFKTGTSSNLKGHAYNMNLCMGCIFAVILAGCFIYIPWISMIFQLGPLEFKFWTAALPFAVAMLAYDEVRKKIARDNVGGWVHKNTVP